MLKNFQKKSNVLDNDDYLNRLVEEYKRFIQLAKKNKVTPSTIIDEFWHFHILNTKDYVKFCDDYIGRYLHHSPSNSPMEEQYEKTLRLYYDTFKEIPNEQFWPRPTTNFQFETKSDTESNSGFFSNWFGSSDIGFTTSENSDSSFFGGGVFGGGGAGSDWGGSDSSSSCSSCGSCGGD
jgi:uncharacterized membrane protein YgcG